jgi:UDP-N-acetylmuramoyl-tripeptide--D-alanyl-D-alanine ligase
MIDTSLFSYCPSVMSKSKHTEHLYICTDTRKFKLPGAFVAIPGAKVNPLDLLDDILQKGCSLVVYQDSAENEQKITHLSGKYPKVNYVKVTDSVTFLQELTHQHILAWKKKSPKNTVFAISGSNGKTTHKEMLSHILKAIIPNKVVATEKNNNNHLGVPLTLLNVSEKTEFVVLELGSNHPGEIKVLCDIAQPNAGITTNIGATHLEFFGDEEKVFEEEAYLYHAVKSVTGGEGFFLINRDDHYLSRLPATAGSVDYGEKVQTGARVKFHETGAEIKHLGADIAVSNTHITGRHNKFNLITCAFIAHHFYPHQKEGILAAAASFMPTKNRSQWMEFEKTSVYLDAYNANPSSMKAALEGFKESVLSQHGTLDKSCIVLGDMNELGENAPKFHEDLGRFVKALGFKHVFFVGRYAEAYATGYPEGIQRKSVSVFKAEYRADCIKKYSIHFIKGSRSLQLESLFDIT